MGKLPASLFYWGDFVRDPDVRRCTHAEVGAWIRLLCLMFEAETKGVLATGGVPWTDEEIAMAIGGKYEETISIVTSLVTKGVASRNEAGSFMNRRMYREEKDRVDTRERVRRHREKHAGNGVGNGDSNANDTRCTESESESEEETTLLFTSEKESKFDAEGIYAAYPRKVGRKSAIRAIGQAFRRLTGLGGEGAYTFNAAEANIYLLGATQEFSKSDAGQAGEFTPHPTTWFNQSRYLDDPKEWKRGGNTHAKPKHHRDTSGNPEFIQQFLDRTKDSGTGPIIEGKP